MSRYYLMAQLPSLDGVGDTTPLPITEERFDELCQRFLGKRVLEELEGLTLVPSRDGQPSGSPLTQAWNDGERQLRLALAALRAAKLGKPYDAKGEESPGLQAMQVAQTAVELDDPLEAEQYLTRYRLAFLDSLRPMDAFSEETVLHYGLKLKLLWRIRLFDAERGQAAYRNIYNSIMDGEEQEVAP